MAFFELTNQALTVVVILVVHQNKGFEYPGLLIYGMALYSFYITITAAVGGGVCTLVIAMAIFMIVRATLCLKEPEIKSS